MVYNLLHKSIKGLVEDQIYIAKPMIQGKPIRLIYNNLLEY